MNLRTLSSTILCGAAAVALLTAGGCGKKSESHKAGGSKSDSTTIKVVVAAITERSFEDWVAYSADLRGIDDATLSAPYLGGRVNSVAKVGTRVKAGEPLCDIDSDRYNAAFKAMQAQVELASGELERAKSNVEKGSLGKSALDGANLGYQNARMGLSAAKRAYEDCQCLAPFSGILVSRSIEKYQTVAPGMPTVRLARVDQLDAVIALPETEAFTYSEGMRAEFTLLQNRAHVYEGKITSLDRAVDTRARTATAHIVIANPDGSLKPGMIGRVSILRRQYPKAIVIPSSALLRLANGVAVMIAENGVARQHVIQMGPATADSTVIESGLDNGELLIVTGGFQVSEGTKISY